MTRLITLIEHIKWRMERNENPNPVLYGIMGYSDDFRRGLLSAYKDVLERAEELITEDNENVKKMLSEMAREVA